MAGKFIWNVLDALKRQFNCNLAFSDYKGELVELLSSEYCVQFHDNPFCRYYEQGELTFYRNCFQCDCTLIRAKVEHSRIFRKLCWTGALELVCPIRKFNQLVGVMFIGPFRPAPSLDGAGGGAICFAKIAPAEIEDRLSLLPEISREELECVEVFGELAVRELERELKEPKNAYGRTTREERIRRFFDHNFRRPCRVDELAAELCLGRTRTEQILKEKYGVTFTRLLNAHRIDAAANRLGNTDLTIGEIAEFVGYRTPNYFHRVFLQLVGVTPEMFRRSRRKIDLLDAIYHRRSDGEAGTGRH